MVEIVIGMASRCPVTFFDEPSSGVDSISRYIFYTELMKDLEEHPRTIILSTHIIEEIENYLSDVIIIDSGKIVVHESLEEVQSQAFTVSGIKPVGKNIIAEQKLGGISIYHIYDTLKEDDIRVIENNGGKIERLPLQKLFIFMMGDGNEN